MKRKIVLIASLVAGLVAAVLTRLYVASCEHEVQARLDAINKRYKTIEALCFKHDVPAGTVLARSDLGLITVPALGTRGQALTRENLTDAIGRKILLGHRKGEVLYWSDVEGGDPNVRGLSADVKRKMRAISINCQGAASVSGMVKPNDHVDVIGTFTFPSEDGRVRKGDVVTSTILQNVLVLATGQTTAKTRASENLGINQGYSTVTLEVTPREAEMLAFTEQMKGRLVLTLRNRNDTSYEKELPKVDFDKIRSEMEELNLKRQQENVTGGR
jgi:pilus assembly protein CpaB